MSLIQDIESAAARAASTVPLSGEVDPDVACHDFVRTEYWARIKAALLAAVKMDNRLTIAREDLARSTTPEQFQFRNAMGE